jgi:hypothetical protein
MSSTRVSTRRRRPRHLGEYIPDQVD